MTETPSRSTEEQTRIQRFVGFFKNYMSVGAVLIAASPILVSLANAIPTYAAHTKLLSVYTSLFCFLVLALIFYFRHALAHHLFGPSVNSGAIRSFTTSLPAILIVLCAASAIGYQVALTTSVFDVKRIPTTIAATRAKLKVQEFERSTESKVTQAQMEQAVQYELERLGGPDGRTSSEVLAQTDLTRIPRSETLIALYVLMFLFAEGAFILMALREYLQDIIGVTDKQLINIEAADVRTEDLRPPEPRSPIANVALKAALWTVALIGVPIAIAVLLILQYFGQYELAKARGGVYQEVLPNWAVLAVYGSILAVAAGAILATSFKPTWFRVLVTLGYVSALTAVLFFVSALLSSPEIMREMLD
jgi:hypothetical protein